MKKRLISTITCVLTFINLLCPCFNVSAATDLSTLTADDLAGTQVPTAITRNLTLPEIDGVWSSSDAAVISDSGVVTRHATEDKAVTLTATPTEGDAVSFDFTVKAKTRKILFSENFNYEGLENANEDADIFASNAMKANGWTGSGTNGSHINADANGNKYAEIGLDSGTTSTKLQPSLTSGKITLDFDLMLTQSSTGSGDAYLIAYLKGDANVLVRLATISSNDMLYWGGDKANGGIKLSTEERLPVSVEIDLANKTFKGSVAGGSDAQYTGSFYSGPLVAQNNSYAEILADSTKSFNQLYQLRFEGSNKKNVDIDNLVLSREIHPLELISADTLAGNQSPTAVTGNLTLPQMDCTWSSSDTDVISDSGVVTRHDTEDKKVTMTAAADDGSGVTVKFNFTVKAKNKKVLASENFAAYSSLTNAEHDTNIYSDMTNWQNSTGTDSHIVQSEGNNNCLEVGFDKDGSDAIRWNIAPEERVFYFDVDFKRDETGMPFNFQVYFSADVNGDTVQKLARLATIYNGDVYWGNNGSSNYTEYTTGEWHSLSFKVDMDNLMTYGSLDGGEWNEVDMLATYGGSFNTSGNNSCTRENTSINYMQRMHFALNSGTSTNVLLDNLALSVDDEVEQGGGENPGEGGETPGEGGETPGEGGETPGEGGETPGEGDEEEEVQDSNVTVTADENGTKVAYKLADIPEGTSAATLVAALIETATSAVKEINWTVCENISSLEGDPKEISVSLTGAESETVKLHYYLCNNITDLFSLKNFAPAQPDLKTLSAEIDTASMAWTAPDDDYESASALRYNIYDDGLLVNETPVSALTYEAQNLVPGAKYHFGIKALDSKGNESNVSNLIMGSTYMPSTIITRIRAKEDAEVNGTPSKDGNLLFGPLPTNADTNLFWYKQDRIGGLNCFSTDACYQSTATGVPNYVRGVSYLAYWLKNAVNADNITYAYEFTYYDQREESEKDAYINMVYCTTRGRENIKVKLDNDKAWKTAKGTFTAAKPLSPIGDSRAGASSQIYFANTHINTFSSEWQEDRPATGKSLIYEENYDEDYTKIYRFTLIPLVNGAEETYAGYLKSAGASLTIENPVQDEAATVISGLDSNAKGFSIDGESKKLTEKGGRLAVALNDINDRLRFTVTDTAVAGKAGNIEICCYAEEDTVVRLNNGSSKKIPANTWTKLRFTQSTVSSSEYSITANNELYVSSLRVTAK